MEAQTWNNIISSFPVTHILQTWQWGRFKSQFGWEPIYKLWGKEEMPDAAALLLSRSVSFAGLSSGLRVLYVPKGPLLRDWDNNQLLEKVIGDLKKFAQEKRAIFIKIDPNVQLGNGLPGTDGIQINPVGKVLIEFLEDRGWIFSDEQIQFRNTILINLAHSADELLSRMKQKTRYNVRLAERKGVKIRYGTESDIDQLYKMYVDTSLRDGFIVRNEAYYRSLWMSFMKSSTIASDQPSVPICEPIIAEVDGLPVAAVVIFRFAGTAYYLHGMSKPIHRNKMPSYLLQWHAMIRSKEAGCTVYDLWGAPDVFDENDSMWGVYRFKQGFGGEVIRTMGAYDLPIQKTNYRIYTSILPKVLRLTRFLAVKKQLASLNNF